MATPYINIYEFFLSEIEDYSFLKLTRDELSEELHIYLRKAIADFDKCKNDLTDRDDALQQFNNDLSDKEQSILASLMLRAYLKSKVVASKHYELILSDTDFKIYSQANHIKELLELYKIIRLEVDKEIVNYTLQKLNMKDMK
ncbi:hypothetical protein B7C51_25195 (plasmid) [Paenibacillus larvae subsp. pulvifaciens]|uniref:Phage protein n=1 Tax=Paenibacillus larvae subsp. pulvifaciens TaxID=1477 RepID=A0A1V0V040_9BACL|nr:hypothetical protein [Paenibacillus larvae]ARF70769.1 hypothetical protein B7C51_25195 [Paenibacillus larvae subsp. pulvifaciens]